jgi:transcriptional regulator with XRE-family HTH domain
MEPPGTLVRRLRLSAGLSQRRLAQAAATSQPAIARYERGVATPSWETLQRLAGVCGRQLTLGTEPVPDPHDIELATQVIGLTPEQRLRALRRYARLHNLAQ